MHHFSFENKKGGLSLPLIILIGTTCALLFAGTLFAIRFFHSRYSPSLSSSERLFQRGRYDDALAFLDRLEHNGRTRPEASVLRGKILLTILSRELKKEQWGSYGNDPLNWLPGPLALEAENCFLRALQDNPEHREARLLLGNLYREQGRFRDAESQFLFVLESYPDDDQAILALGILYAENERYAQSEQFLRRAWENDPQNPSVAKNMAFLFRFYKEYPESSIVWLNRYLNLDPARDLDKNLARQELQDLLERYPEFELEEAQSWREKTRSFIPNR